MKSNSLNKIFKTSKPIIGVIHFKPLLGVKGFTSLGDILKKSIQDLKTYELGGVDAVMLENNYDLPHVISVGPETVASMTWLATNLKERTKLPLGICVLWNDFKAGFAIAKVVDAKFIRISVFVDDVITDFGKVTHVAKEATLYRKKIHAENILIFADVQVKHAKMIDSKKTLKTSINQAIQAGADSIIITGDWTGDAPSTEEVTKAKLASGITPILIGSGVSEDNIDKLLSIADGVIVSTSLKEGNILSKKINRNLKSYNRNINLEKVKGLVKKAKKLT